MAFRAQSLTLDSQYLEPGSQPAVGGCGLLCDGDTSPSAAGVYGNKTLVHAAGGTAVPALPKAASKQQLNLVKRLFALRSVRPWEVAVAASFPPVKG